MLKEAMVLVGELHALLCANLAATAEERRRLSVLDPEALGAWVASRESRNHQALVLEQGILQRLAAACGEGEEAPSLERLRELRPTETERLDRELEELRTLAEALRREDQLTQAIVQSSRAFVQRYLTALAPTSAAYDRRGQTLEHRPPSTLRVSL